jgi:hypothetical protein
MHHMCFKHKNLCAKNTQTHEITNFMQILDKSMNSIAMHGTMKLLVDKILKEGLEQSNIANYCICELSKPFVVFCHDAYGFFILVRIKLHKKTFN